MKLLSWKPYVTGAGSAIEVYFGVKALLECPVCKKRRKVTTSVHNIDSGPNNLIFWSVGALVRVDDPEEGNGPCRGCGVLSTLPEADSKRLVKEMGLVVTKKWLKQKAERKNVQLRRAG